MDTGGADLDSFAWYKAVERVAVDMHAMRSKAQTLPFPTRMC